MSDRKMYWRFGSVPHDGVEVEEDDPLVGWRVEFVKDGRLFNADRDGWLRTEQCDLQPTSLVPLPKLSSPFGDGGHEAPHPRCKCGLRLLAHPDGLHDYWSTERRAAVASGLQLTDEAVVRVSAVGRVTRGDPVDDPRGSIRVAQGRVLEIYVPMWVDRGQVRRRNPAATVRPITALDGDLFGWMRSRKPPKPTLLWQSRPRTVWVKTAAAELEIPRTWLQPKRVVWAVNQAVTDEYGGTALQIVTEALVIPLVDLDEIPDRHELAGIAVGVAHALIEVSTEDRARGDV